MTRLTLLIAFMLSMPALAGIHHFRYVNEDGVSVLSQSLPPQVAPRGYDIVDSYGRLIKRVAPQLAEDVFQDQQRKEAAKAECESHLRRVRSLYSAEEDIYDAEKIALTGLDNRLAQLKASLMALSNQRKEFEREAARRERAGETVPNTLLESRTKALSQETNLESQIDQRQDDKRRVRGEFDEDRRIFKIATCNSSFE